jgi:O-antigen ligase
MFPLLIAVLSLLTLIAAVVSNGNAGATAAPVAVFAVAYGIWKMPLRIPALALIFAALVLENPSENPACGLWQSPLYPVGALLLYKMNNSIPVKALVFSGIDLLLVFFFIVIVARHMPRHRAAPAVRTAPPLVLWAAIALGYVFLVWGYGLARGGEFQASLWQVTKLLYLPVVFLLFQGIFGPSDFRRIGGAIVVAACVRAAAAVLIRMLVRPPSGSEMPYATTHNDSILFACAFGIILALILERRTRRAVFYGALTIALLFAGMVANGRRIVWVAVAAVALVYLFATPYTRWKRALLRSVLVLTPVIAIYTAVGWHSGASIFRPVQLLRSMADSSSDASTAWRDMENFNLLFTVRQFPLLGTGLGHGFTEQMKLPDISKVYDLYRHAPHNSILGTWAYCGYAGFSAMWMMFVVGAMLAFRSYRRAQDPIDRAAALSVLAVLAVHLVQCYGDMGLGSWDAVFIVAPALVVAGKLAVCTGAWQMGDQRQTRAADGSGVS